MLNLIRRILQEEAEMKEMGMKINKLQQLQPSNYLLKSLKQKQSRAYRSTSDKAKADAEQLNSLVPELYESLRNLDWSEISMNKDPNGHFYLKFPKHIMDLFKLISKIYVRIPDRYDRLIDNVDKVRSLNSDYISTIKTGQINMYVERGKNRTHFPDGLPQSLLGYRLGYKMYRKLIDDLWFVQSQENASKEVQEIYRQLLQQTDLNCVVTKNTILIMRRDLTKEDKIKILSEYLYQAYEFTDKDRLKIQKDIILDGPLLRELGGERKLQQLMDRITEYSIKVGRLSYKQGDPLEYDYPYDPNEEKEVTPRSNYNKDNEDNEEDDESEESCDYCGGEGRAECSSCSGDGYECFDCDSTGYVDCPECNGSGLANN